PRNPRRRRCSARLVCSESWSAPLVSLPKPLGNMIPPRAGSRPPRFRRIVHRPCVIAICEWAGECRARPLRGLGVFHRLPRSFQSFALVSQGSLGLVRLASSMETFAAVDDLASLPFVHQRHAQRLSSGI